LARGVNGICPEVTSSPEPTMRTTWARTRSTGDVQGLEHACREPLLLTQEPEEDVLRADVVVLERPRLLLRENDDLPGPFCESLEHCC
jgi:hypothetical protein